MPSLQRGPFDIDRTYRSTRMSPLCSLPKVRNCRVRPAVQILSIQIDVVRADAAKFALTTLVRRRGRRDFLNAMSMAA